MRMVPGQLRIGITGNVPYYGGRFTPAQAFAAAHPTRPPPPSAADKKRLDQLRKLQRLRDAGVITPDEYDTFQARVTKSLK